MIETTGKNKADRKEDEGTMEQLKALLEQCVREGLYQIIMSNPRKKGEGQKIKIRPVMLKGSLCYQCSSFVGAQVFHQNLDEAQMQAAVLEGMQTQYKQLEIHAKPWQATVLVGKKGNVTVKKKQSAGEKAPELSHNRKKQYILDEHTSVGFLQELGVQTAEGKIVHSKYDKFKQINRFLEFIQDVLPALPKDRCIKIVDFGCGKSYLTFAMYYYLKILKQYQVKIIGLDLKADVIEHCNRLCEKYGYEDLRFYQGDIKDFTGAEQVDMVVTLHACDTATDYALEKAVRWGAGVILSVPCCQHELNRQIQCDALAEPFSYGLIQERCAALLTDAIRALLLETRGYDTQIMEFIDMEHTPKNIMLRCIRRNGRADGEKERQYRMEKREKVRELMRFLQVQPTLDRLLQE